MKATHTIVSVLCLIGAAALYCCAYIYWPVAKLASVIYAVAGFGCSVLFVAFKR